MDYLALWNELNADPLSRGYSGMTAASAAANLNQVNRTRNRATMEAFEVFNAVKVTEFNALSSASKQLVWDMIHMGTLNPFGLEATLFNSIFGSSSSTIQTLAGLRASQVSRADELGLGYVYEGHVIKARALGGQ